jgi:hypothetical protein
MGRQSVFPREALRLGKLRGRLSWLGRGCCEEGPKEDHIGFWEGDYEDLWTKWKERLVLVFGRWSLGGMRLFKMNT